MNIKDKVLVVEDEKGISGFIRAILTANGYDVILAHTGAEAFSMISSHCPDLIVLDLGLPDMDGMNIISAVRQWTQMPIVVVSARTYERDKVEALDKGADDYITKPFGAAELLARIRTTLRRLSYAQIGAGSSEGAFDTGELHIDYDAGIATMDGEELHLTPIEYKLLCLLSKNVGKVLTHTYITQQIWGSSWENDIASLRVFMATLRKKLERGKDGQQYIQTHIGIGYRMLRVE